MFTTPFIPYNWLCPYLSLTSFSSFYTWHTFWITWLTNSSVTCYRVHYIWYSGPQRWRKCLRFTEYVIFPLLTAFEEYSNIFRSMILIDFLVCGICFIASSIFTKEDVNNFYFSTLMCQLLLTYFIYIYSCM